MGDIGQRGGRSSAEADHEVQPDLRARAGTFLVNRDFARLWYGQAISTVGDFVFDTTLTIWVATQLFARSHWAPAAVSGLMLCALAAIILVGPVAGVFVDRWSRRRTMLASEVIRGLLVGLLTLVTLLPRDALPASVWLIILYGVVFVVNAAGQFFNPARFATVGEIVADEADRAKAVGLGQATAATAAVVGPPLAAPLLFTLGIQWALLINALSYAVSFFAVRSVHFPMAAVARATGEAARKQAWRVEFAAGVKMFTGNRFLVALLTVAVISSLGVGAVTPLLVFFMSDNLHTSTRLLGLMTMAYGLGSVAGSLVSGRAARLVGARNLTWLGLLATGCLLSVYARQTDFTAALVLMFLMAIPVAALNAGLSPLLMAVTPKDFMGRMIAVFTPVNMAASVGSVVIAGCLASTVLAGFHATVAGRLHVGRIDTIYTVSACLIVASGIYGCVALPRSSSKLGDDLAGGVPVATLTGQPGTVGATESSE
ncbi:MAG TPA: MFS transporter [Oryzihumus sp.]|nr:MFS transporter [Oryzihumus sp.]